MNSSSLQISGLTKRYGDFVALAPTDLEVAKGEFLTLLGPSGSGKTTLLSLIAGLALPDGGRLLIDGQDVTHGAPYERDIGMVFQNYALFPHMTVAENIAFPLKMRNVDAASAKRRAMEALELVRLPHLSQRYPKELSGGQQQRIALARCLVYKPAIVLMDEPLGALDKKLRDQMQLEIKRIHRELGTTIVYVTHDQEEAMTMSDRICLMNQGRVEQLGTPSDLYFRPRTLFVADFLGESNLLAGTVESVEGGEAQVQLAQNGGRALAAVHAPLSAGSKVRVMVRPQNIAVRAGAGDVNAVHGKVLDSMITGSLTKLYVSAPSAGPEPLVMCYPTSSGTAPHAIGDDITLHWSRGDAVAVPEEA
ncbi:ABC transporter ATP-binding protein [Ramlibacter sp. Leaf400]|uniref:ABC transporter ATP-binding protein n=1 Tax=Ramlibacter sp. Leaf400 TaxID=1736365 RepID=UPI0007017083|nr:ABC transporter ATP-binding protein [Ramlibacter sp. Leaf400]KQT13316.1 spermidine/putrescine ABC transporter ATP-binding protein [Ramlibacter sp. Leaf400]